VSFFFALQTSAWAEDLTWEEDPVFAGLQAELQEIAATQSICKTYLDLHNRYPQAEFALLSLRKIIEAQISRGQRELSLPIPSDRGRRNVSPCLPSIFAPPEYVSNLSDQLLAAFKARKTAYINLIRATESIAELSLASVCYLHQMKVISDEEAFNRLLSHYKSAINSGVSGIVTRVTINGQSPIRLETAVILVQLAKRLERID
jgi:hypothetical protein